MKNFIALSPSSKNALRIIQMSSSLPINILIIGQNGVGKKLLMAEVFSTIKTFNGKDLEELIFKNQINLDSFNSLVIYDIEKVINRVDFFKKLKDIRVIATSFQHFQDSNSFFPVNIMLEPLKNRKEDLKELINIYKIEAQKIYNLDMNLDDIKIDLSQNGISLKQSIYKSILLKSLTESELKETMQYFFIKEFKNNQTTYKQLLKIFEIAILKSAKNVYKSQLKMATKLGINRITLRKKLDIYGENNV